MDFVQLFSVLAGECREASPLLSNNRFRFPQVFTDTSFLTDSAHIAPFLYQIGSQASLIHHICITFPSFDHSQPGKIRFYKEHVKNLELVRDTCTSIRTLELFVLPNHGSYALSNSEIAAEAMDLLDIRFKAISSLREITINFEICPEQDPEDDLPKKMDDCGWAVSTTKLPKQVWICDEHGIEFDNEEDYNTYMNDVFLRREEEEEQKLWREEYYRRRHDPYWKNDPDYD